MMRGFATAMIALLLCHCGGNGGLWAGGNFSATDQNTVAVTVDPGPLAPGQVYTNGLFASATVCVPGTTTCQTIDNLLVDTGSVGLRVLESELTIALPSAKNASGLELAECTQFVDGVAWGPVKIADVHLGGETATHLPIQAIGESTYPVAARCLNVGNPINDLQTLSSKGILGVGLFVQDCGKGCAPGSPGNSGLYYACGAKDTNTCTKTLVPLDEQVTNPVAKFLINNNGSIIRLPDVPANGSSSVAGLLVFGIGTQPNNELGSAKIIALDSNGFATTTFPAGATAHYSSYIDSGSNGLFFLDARTTNLEQCTGTLSEFYCPSSTTSLDASLATQDGDQTTVRFAVTSASSLSARSCAFSNLAGPMPGFPTDSSVPGFDWGLPFYFGRTVFTAIATKSTPAGIAPYFAF